MRLLIVVASLLSFATPSEASQVRSVNLEEMVQRADRVFSGRCLGVRVAHDPALDRTVTYVTFSVQRVVKGDLHGRVRIKMLGNVDATATPDDRIEGLPRFQAGEEVVLFLHGDSARGLTSPVGFSQGKFAVVHDKQGRPVAINGMRNEHLFRGISPRAEGPLGAHAARQKDERGIPPDVLLDMAEALQQKREGRR
ncbi:MAG TPA: hypothetical protein VFG76_09700 [Candidatus Polarisedimenticolia bacterium]|nr:hypothetical protein [Candidatus Polarisedimenticolia bacterium]